MKKAFLAIFLALGLVVALAAPVFAGVSVYNGKIEQTVSPGQTYTYTMTVQNSSDSPADFGVEVDGYGTSANQDFVVLSPADDTSPESARTMLTVTPTAFHLEANATQDLTVTATIPPGTGAGGRYAIIFIHTIAASGQQVATVSAVAARVLLTVTGNTTDTTTQVTALAPTAAVNNTAGVLVTLNDSGNYYVKPQVEATLMDGSKIIATGTVDTGWPIIPGYSRQYQVNFTGSGTIPAGKYQVAVNVKDGAGNLLAQSTYPVQFTTQQVLQTTTTTSAAAPGASTVTVVQKSGGSINWTIIIVAIIAGVIIIALVVLLLQKRKTL